MIGYMNFLAFVWGSSKERHRIQTLDMGLGTELLDAKQSAKAVTGEATGDIVETGEAMAGEAGRVGAGAGPEMAVQDARGATTLWASRRRASSAQLPRSRRPSSGRRAPKQRCRATWRSRARRESTPYAASGAAGSTAPGSRPSTPATMAHTEASRGRPERGSGEVGACLSSRPPLPNPFPLRSTQRREAQL